MSQTLHPYQHEGVRFLLGLQRGGILADDVGLGKTIQTARALCERFANKSRVLAATSYTLSSDMLDCALLVAPSEVFTHWTDSLRGSLRVKCCTSGEELKHNLQSARYGCVDVLMITYQMMERQVQRLVSGSTQWKVLVFDEVHFLKNKKSLSYRAAVQLVACSTYVWGLTATPIQNNMAEFHTLSHLVTGCTFDSVDAMIRANVLLRRDFEHLPADHRPPDVDLHEIGCEPSDVQAKLFEVFHKKSIQFSEIVSLRLLATHPLLLEPSMDHSENRQAWWTQILDLYPDIQSRDPIALSGKLHYLVHTLLPSLKNLNKILLFSQSLRVFDILYPVLTEFTVFRIDARTPHAERLSLFNDFAACNTPALCMMTPRIGAHGLNLQMAQVVILLDRNWNDTIDEQAIGRVHRQGQTETVKVFYLFTKTSIEERVREINEQKVEIRKGIKRRRGDSEVLRHGEGAGIT